MRRELFAIVGFVYIAIAGCNGTAIPPPGRTLPATPAPSPTPTPGPLSAAPTTLTFSATGLAQALTIADPDYSGEFTISGCSGIVTVGSVVSGTVNITSAAGGTCTLTVADALSHQVTVSVSVNTLSVPIQ